jgi:hypothetical protein
MCIIWNESFESDNPGKGGMTLWHMVKTVHGAKKVENHWSSYFLMAAKRSAPLADDDATAKIFQTDNTLQGRLGKGHLTCALRHSFLILVHYRRIERLMVLSLSSCMLVVKSRSRRWQQKRV